MRYSFSIPLLTEDQFLGVAEEPDESHFEINVQQAVHRSIHPSIQQRRVDWIIEILTDHPTHSRQVRNILHSLDNGTKMGWLIDPDEELIFVYSGNHTVFVFEDPNTLVPVPDFASTIQLTIGQIFSWLEN